MRATTIRASLAAALLLGLSGTAMAQHGGGGGGGGGDGGSGLSPYAALSGNDRSAGVNNGNYRDPRLDPYVQAYPRYARPVDDSYRPVRRRYYGNPY
ncbi:hypothetical protein [Methylobacterium planeticum]|uniref:Uncharacterized protein n=1 Tax=Methylobacterium planeticum TaxID=2615211 RepID=A0A6N6MJW0_9HYPH|nr:hypothetical protein [Methylobacterium planeticum]KAB1070321.1 hypothetical protein F6X51_23205 [Methylobacterium planeticum]